MDRRQERTGEWRPRFATLLALLGVVVVLPWVLTPRAEAFVYWTSPGKDRIGRANLDGSGANPFFIRDVGALGSVAVDAHYVYWPTTGGIARANLDGTDVNKRFIKTTSRYPAAVAVDPGHIYWVESRGDPPSPVSIALAELDGTAVDPDFIGGVPAASLAIDGGHIYWAANGAIARANLDGAGVNTSFIAGAYASAIAVGAEGIYWVNSDSIGRANLDGTGIDPTLFGGDPITAWHTPIYGDPIAVDDAHIYSVTLEPTPQAHSYAVITRATIDGTAADVIVAPGFAGASGLAVDGLSDSTPPNTTITKRAPNKTGDNAFKFRSSEPNSTFECKLDEKSFRPCSSPKKLKHPDAGKHTFQVRAVDAATNVDPTPATDRFKVAR